MGLARGGWLVIADGAKFLVFENRGTRLRPDLRIRRMRIYRSPRTSRIGTDRPGRYPGPGRRREVVETTDWHRLDEARLTTTVSDELNEAAARGRLPPLMLVADPRTLGRLRPRLSAAVRRRLVGEIAADWTGLPVERIERRLAETLPDASALSD